jgi:hypothetical protein
VRSDSFTLRVRQARTSHYAQLNLIFSTTTSKSMANQEEAVQLAIRDYKNGVYSSQKAAAAAYNVPRSTFRDRLQKNRQPPRAAHEWQQRLTSPQEEFLVQWIQEEEARGYSPSHARAREMATRVLRANGDTKPLGKKWITHFIARHPEIGSVIGTKIGARRVQSTAREAIQEFFNRFEAIRKEFNSLIENTCNMDEQGLGLVNRLEEESNKLRDVSSKKT